MQLRSSTVSYMRLILLRAWPCGWLRFDANNDGVLDPSEQTNFAEAFGAEYKDAILTQLSELDEDHDGNIDPVELAKFLIAETESDDERLLRIVFFTLIVRAFSSYIASLLLLYVRRRCHIKTTEIIVKQIT